ncbi:MAG: pantoate--beta-alanine ligase [Bacteroidota bacterium]
MYLFKRVDQLRAFLNGGRTNNRTVGFVPTMGALHQGHLSLVERSLAENQVTVASIFVNPTQFNEASDLEKYPRTPGKDLEKLAKVGCTVAFLPEVSDMYPPGLDTNLELDFGTLDKTMEGSERPGHFNGVAQVVNRLLEIVTPEYLYMGQKDFQQQLIVREMTRLLQLNTQVVTVPTARENDGLAMSSRNVRLTTAARAQAPTLYQTLQAAKERLTKGEKVADIEHWALSTLQQETELRPEYFSIVDADTLLSLNSAASLPERIVACTAVWAGEIRLIDNLLLQGKL